MSALLRLFPLLLLGFGSLSCGIADGGSVARRTAGRAPFLPVNPIEWSYQGETGPAKWAGLDESFRMCDGRSQSPIDLPAVDPGMYSLVEYDYQLASVRLSDQEKYLDVQVEYGGEIELRGIRYFLDKIQVHVPGEHTIGGKAYPAEVHLVHETLEGRRLIVAVHVDAGKTASPFFDALTGIATAPEPDANVAGLHPADVLPVNRAFYLYKGSLTSPPCSEGVQWVVMRNPIEASSEQMNQLKALYDANNRPVQPTNDRRILMAAPKQVEVQPEEAKAVVSPPARDSVVIEPAEGSSQTTRRRRTYRSTNARNRPQPRPGDLECAAALDASTVLPMLDDPTFDRYDRLLSRPASQMVFNTANRYVIGGEQMVGAFHFAHVDPYGQPLIVAIPVKLGEAHPHGQEMRFFPAGQDSASIGDAVHWQELLPPDWKDRLYAGPLSTNCTSQAQWIVVGHPLELSEEQLEAWMPRRP